MKNSGFYEHILKYKWLPNRVSRLHLEQENASQVNDEKKVDLTLPERAAGALKAVWHKKFWQSKRQDTKTVAKTKRMARVK